MKLNGPKPSKAPILKAETPVGESVVNPAASASSGSGISLPVTPVPFTVEELEGMTGEEYHWARVKDEEKIGTSEYRGAGWFWNAAYRHALREATPEDRVKVHAAFLAAKLSPDGSTAKHTKIVRDVFPNW